jgi:hypothetical protein
MKNLMFMLAFFGTFTSMKAQLDFTNLLSCDVVITWEMRDTGCGVCASGTSTLISGNTLYMTACSGYIDMCINVTDIGGCTLTQNCHLSEAAGCHFPNFVNSCSGNVTCCGNTAYTATWNGTNFLIQ